MAATARALIRGMRAAMEGDARDWPLRNARVAAQTPTDRSSQNEVQLAEELVQALFEYREYRDARRV
jgi:hypothetical protein